MAGKGLTDKQEFEETLRKRGLALPSETLELLFSYFSSLLDEKLFPLTQTIESLGNTISSLNSTIASLQESIKEKDDTIKVQGEKLAALEEKNNRNCSNSNRPSSWDHFSKPSPKPSSICRGDGPKRKNGGQKGHKGTTMKLKAEPDRIVDLVPAKCSACPHLAECRTKASRRSSRTVVDVVVKTEQTEYRELEFTCPGDGKVLLGEYPSFVNAAFQYGPVVDTVVTELSMEGSVGMDKVKSVMNGIFGLSMTDATVDNILKRASEGFSPVVEKFKDTFSSVHVGHFDETGCRWRGRNAWLHIAASELFSVFGFSTKRGEEGTRALGCYGRMERPGQVVMTDFWKSYISLDGGTERTHAFCCAHLDRELQNGIDNYGSPAPVRKMKKLLKYAYVEVQKLKRKGEEKAPQKLLDEVSARYDGIVRAALNRFRAPKMTGKRGRPAKGKMRALFERFRDYKKGVLMFLHDFEVPFSNNPAEICAKACKSKLKVSGCFRGEQGPDRFCTIKSVLETCKKHGLNPIDILREMFSGVDVSRRFGL